MRICYISNAAPHYREAIFHKIDRTFTCDFFIGDTIPRPVEYMEYRLLKGFRRTLLNIPLAGQFYWQKGAVWLAFQTYTHYLLDGEPYCLSTWLILWILRIRRKKVFLWSHSWYGNEGWIKRLVKRCFFRLADTVLLYGNYARNLMTGLGFDPRRLICIYNSLDYARQVRLRNQQHNTSVYHDHFRNDDPVLLFLGRIQRNKKPEMLISALQRLSDGGIRCNLVMIGEEMEQTGIHELTQQYSLGDRVWFMGPLYDENRLAAYIMHAAVCISPGNVGLTAIHCLTYGTPVITHDNFTRQGPEFEAITPGHTGDFFRENDLEALCEKTRFWTSLTYCQRLIVQQECYKTVEARYNPEYQIGVLKEVFGQGKENA